jgi:Zn-finger nucleic acid-binding protein
MNPNRNAMPCPIDGTNLVPTERQGIEIDYCPACRGVWLDRGELDKIIERSAQAFAPQPQAAPQPPPPQGGPWPGRYGDHGNYHHKKRRKSFLEELFD